MKAIEIRNKFLEFFKKHNHTIIPSAPLIPENDPSVLFTTAGMQPLVPYLLGEKHPGGKRIADYQKCVRTVDIDSVGDNRHLTYFEMLGNWSLGDYFKKDAIAMSYKFLTEELGIDPEKLSVTCFAGDADAPKDIEAFEAWKNAGIPEERIYFYGKEDNWWIAGEEGPCGPDTEMFLDTGKPACSENCQPSCNCGKYVEIWNNVFMEYYKSKDGIKKLEQKNVDTGLGLERMAMLLQKVETPFDTELFKPVMEELEKLEKIDDIKSRRIVAEHLRSSIMIIADGGRPSNIDRGYVLRRLIRRMTRHMSKLQIDLENISDLIETDTINNLNEMYPELQTKRDIIKNVIIEEKDKFIKTLGHGEKEFEKVINKLEQENKNVIDGKTIFKLYETYGFPPEITADLAQEKGYKIDLTEFDKLFKEHQEKSRLGSEQKFKGGLAEQNEITTAYHTATHLLHQALRNVLGDHVKQSGSNITTERLRFDFSHPEKMTPEQIKQVEDIVNEQIKRDLNVVSEEMPLEEAKKSGAIGLFENKYGDTVKVYTIGDFSKEICGGPHVKHTGELGHFKIKKEESSSAGIRRIKAILE